MSVVGIGTDIIEITRLREMSEAVFERLARRVLLDSEYHYMRSLKSPVEFLAKRWAGKEAAAKALGTGIAQGVSFHHFNIERLSSGQPELKLTDQALVIAKALRANHWHISLSDEKNYATAFVVLSQ